VAAILILPLIAYLAWDKVRDDSKEYAEYRFEVISPKGQISRCVLPDGTSVWLNYDSRITYNVSSNQSARVVHLEGEGYFDVTEDKEMPFEVKTGNAIVKVFGTKFNVNGYESDEVSVTLEEGEVGLYSDKSTMPKAMLKPGEQAVLSSGGYITRKDAVDTEIVTAWTEGKFIFRNESLKVIAERLEYLFDVKVFFEDSELESFRYRGVIEYENSVFHALEMLKKSSDIRFTMTGRNIYLRKKN
jgi:ferric-dicitrate binding protein FerR (iron transport regulator)